MAAGLSVACTDTGRRACADADAKRERYGPGVATTALRGPDMRRGAARGHMWRTYPWLAIACVVLIGSIWGAASARTSHARREKLRPATYVSVHAKTAHGRIRGAAQLSGHSASSRAQTSTPSPRITECHPNGSDGSCDLIGHFSTLATSMVAAGTTIATAITAGGEHSCALLSTGQMECWGLNEEGRLGNGTSTGPALCGSAFWCSTTPVPVSGITNATAISGGSDHTCAVLSAGNIDCWGYNLFGQLGNGSTTNSSTPVQVSGISNGSATRGGEHHSCARLASGQVDCWGENLGGQLGNGSTTDSSTPVQVSGISKATTVSAGGFHSCAVLSKWSGRLLGREP